MSKSTRIHMEQLHNTGQTPVPMKKAVLVDKISDHLPIYLNLGIVNGNELTARESSTRIFSKRNLAKFKSLLTQLDTSAILSSTKTNESYECKEYKSNYVRGF